MDDERTRLAEARDKGVPWRKWGPYLSERQWGTVREDYSASGDAWNYFTHDQARSRAYRWGEDGLAGISDEQQHLCISLALWNGKDSILKERLFGLTNNQGNHGEDVKEYYFYLDSTPTHSYMKYLYKYPQGAYPYEDLIATNKQRTRCDQEYELLDTGVFDENRYFDVFVEYAKASPEDMLIQITVHNRGPDPAALHLLPTLWFRNTWAWSAEAVKPVLRGSGRGVISISHRDLGERIFECEGAGALLFTENDTNSQRLFGIPNATPYVKDGIEEYLVRGRREAVNPALFCQNMMEIAAELSMNMPAYLDMLLKFIEHFLLIAAALMSAGDGTGMWDEEDGFFYDVLRLPDGRAERLKVRSMVGLLPICAATVFDGKVLAKYPEVAKRARKIIDARPELCAFIHSPVELGPTGRRLMSVLNEDKLRRVLAIMLDEKEFLSLHGIRALSQVHAEQPYVFCVADQEYRVSFLPAESDNAMFGGNSNWRGPVWMPVNTLIIRALLQYYLYYGDGFTIECPTGSGQRMTLYQVAEEISRRLGNIFLRDGNGRRPVYGGTRKFQEDPYWRDLILFYEYFHGENGAGLGASHQTGWTGVIARLMQIFATLPAEQLLARGAVRPE